MLFIMYHKNIKFIWRSNDDLTKFFTTGPVGRNES
jgi:hypothetical protein